jgi:hypothetical protein
MESMMTFGKTEKGNSKLARTTMGLAILGAIFMAPTSAQAQQVSGAIFTTDANCGQVDKNIYALQSEVYLNGGPTHTGAAGLPDGQYYIKVTDPSGATLLGNSVPLNNTATVANGNFTSCIQLSSFLLTPQNLIGYDPTPNAGGEYKVWVSTDPNFLNPSTKTDNFKVKRPDETTSYATLRIKKFYDADLSGQYTSGEQYLEGWKVGIADCINDTRYTTANMIVEPGNCVVSEYMPIQTNWIRTTPSPVTKTLGSGADVTVEFGNVCIGAGGGLTLGYWSNKNGQATFTGASGNLPAMVALNLRNANGTPFDPADYSAFRTWILNATATNMAYMLSAQLATAKLNVLNGFVTGSSLIYAPGATSANAVGFTTINAVIDEANTSLASNGLTVTTGAVRTYQEALKNALDSANNNFNFLQTNPSSCSYTFQ